MRTFFSIFLLIFLCLKAFSAGVSVIDAAGKLDLDISWDPLSQELIFMKDNSQVSCKIGESLIVYDNQRPDFISPPYQKDGLTFISSEMYKKLETFFSVPQKETKYRVGVILIDPGHGGKDPGCIGS